MLTRGNKVSILKYFFFFYVKIYNGYINKVCIIYTLNLESFVINYYMDRKKIAWEHNKISTHLLKWGIKKIAYNYIQRKNSFALFNFVFTYRPRTIPKLLEVAHSCAVLEVQPWLGTGPILIKTMIYICVLKKHLISSGICPPAIMFSKQQSLIASLGSQNKIAKIKSQNLLVAILSYCWSLIFGFQ